MGFKKASAALFIFSLLGAVHVSYAKSVVKVDVAHRLALPIDQVMTIAKEKSWTQKEKTQVIDEFVEAHATIECQTQICGEDACQYVENMEYYSAPFDPNKPVEVLSYEHGKMSGKIYGGRLVKLSDIPNLGGEKILYFSKLECSDEPPLKKVAEDVPALNEFSKMENSSKSCETESEGQGLSDHLRRFRDASCTLAGKIQGSPTTCFLLSIGAKLALDHGLSWISQSAGKSPVIQAVGATAGQFVQQALSPKQTPSQTVPEANRSERASVADSLKAVQTVYEVSGFKGIVDSKIKEQIEANRNQIVPESLISSNKQNIVSKQKQLESLRREYEMRLQNDEIFEVNKPTMKLLFEELDRMMAGELQDQAKGSNGFQISKVFGYMNLEELLKRASASLSIPFRNKRIDIADAKAKLEALLKNQDPNLQATIVPFLEKIVEDSYVPGNDETTRKSMLYFYGSPATGKTRLARGIAEGLGMEFKEIVVGSRSPAEISKEIDSVLSNAKSKNVMIFFDEIGDALNEASKTPTHSSSGRNPMITEFLPFMEPNNTRSPSKIFQVEGGPSSPPFYTDIGKLVIVMASNFKIQDEALRQRIPTVTFPKVPFDLREKIAEEIFAKKLVKAGGIRIEDLTPQDREMIKKIVVKDHATYDGVRILDQALEAYAYHKKAQITKPRLDLFSRHEKGQVKGRVFDVDQFYEQFNGVE